MTITEHRCPGGCRRAVPDQLYACRACWYRLPAAHRQAITSTYRRDVDAHADAMYDAYLWYVDHPLTEEKDCS